MCSEGSLGTQDWVNFLSKISLPLYVISKSLPKKVFSGPFEGMNYLSVIAGSVGWDL